MVRTIALDTDTCQVLRAHRQQQQRERLAMAEAWIDTGFVFTQPDGNRLHSSTSPTSSCGWPTWPACHPSGSTTCAMAPPR